MFGHVAFGALAVVFLEQCHGVGFDVEGRDAERAFAGEANQVPINFLLPKYAADPKLNMEFGPGMGPSVSTSVLT
jgi:hypothetical protein